MRGWRPWRLRFGSAPFPDVVQVDRDAESVRRHKPPLPGAQPDDRDDCTVGAGHQPALPFAPAHQHRGPDREQTRKIIEVQHRQFARIQSSCFFLRRCEPRANERKTLGALMLLLLTSTTASRVEVTRGHARGQCFDSTIEQLAAVSRRTVRKSSASPPHHKRSTIRRDDHQVHDDEHEIVMPA